MRAFHLQMISLKQNILYISTTSTYYIKKCVVYFSQKKNHDIIVIYTMIGRSRLYFGVRSISSQTWCTLWTRRYQYYTLIHSTLNYYNGRFQTSKSVTTLKVWNFDITTAPPPAPWPRPSTPPRAQSLFRFRQARRQN